MFLFRHCRQALKQEVGTCMESSWIGLHKVQWAGRFKPLWVAVSLTNNVNGSKTEKQQVIDVSYFNIVSVLSFKVTEHQLQTLNMRTSFSGWLYCMMEINIVIPSMYALLVWLLYDKKVSGINCSLCSLPLTRFQDKHMWGGNAYY